MDAVRLIIAGGREFRNYAFLTRELDRLTERLDPITVISGDARGADQLGARWAETRGYAVEHFPAQWNTFGKSAGYKRNADMARHATHLVAFWDGKSRGTSHMIEQAKIHGLKVRVVRY